jgi:hypothetical protein
MKSRITRIIDIRTVSGRPKGKLRLTTEIKQTSYDMHMNTLRRDEQCIIGSAFSVRVERSCSRPHKPKNDYQRIITFSTMIWQSWAALPSNTRRVKLTLWGDLCVVWRYACLPNLHSGCFTRPIPDECHGEGGFCEFMIGSSFRGTVCKISVNFFRIGTFSQRQYRVVSGCNLRADRTTI